MFVRGSSLTFLSPLTKFFLQQTQAMSLIVKWGQRIKLRNIQRWYLDAAKRKKLQKGWKVFQPFNLQTFKRGLVDQRFFFVADALAEHVVCPTLVGEDDGNEDQGYDGHHRQRVLRGGCVVDGQRPVGICGGGHHVGEGHAEEGDLGQHDVERDQDESPAFAFLVDEISSRQECDERGDGGNARVNDAACPEACDVGEDTQRDIEDSRGDP